VPKVIIFFYILGSFYEPARDVSYPKDPLWSQKMQYDQVQEDQHLNGQHQQLRTCKALYKPIKSQYFSIKFKARNESKQPSPSNKATNPPSKRNQQNVSKLWIPNSTRVNLQPNLKKEPKIQY